MNGSRQDIAIDAELCVCWNRPVYLKFLLCSRECGNYDNKLEESLFCLLSSTEFTGVMRGMSIILVCVTNLLLWLAGKIHELAAFGWSTWHMSRVCDDLEETLVDIIEDHSLFLKEFHMKNMFKRKIEMLESFKEFLEHKFDTQEKRFVKNSDGSINKIRSCRVTIKELFKLEKETNISKTDFVDEISQRLCGPFLQELRDTKKSICKYLSSLGVELSWDKATEADIEN